MQSPLKLKAERALVPAGPRAIDRAFAGVWVDSGVPLLNSAFTYLVPEKLSKAIEIGSRVQVPFRDRQVEGLVISRSNESNGLPNLKSIYKVLGEHPVATIETISLIAATAKFWAGVPYDVIRSAIPVRVVSAEKELPEPQPAAPPEKANTGEISFVLLPPMIDPIAALIKIYQSESATGSQLIMVPTQRDLNQLTAQLTALGLDFLSLDSSMARADRYRKFLEASVGVSNLIVGMRSAIFTPIPNLKRIYVHQENSEHYFERRAPYWNVREVAIMRSKSEKLNLILTGYLPSMQVTQLVESKSILYKANRERVKVLAQPSVNGELVPSKIFQEIRKSIKLGPVLFLVPAKGYASAISCAKCRNIALCECGGKLVKEAAASPPSCTLCAKKYLEWKCNWCHENRIYLAGRGLERIAEEIGRSFSGIRIIQSNLGNNVSEIDTSPALVISTAGSEPRVANGYNLVVILQVDKFLSSSSVTGSLNAYSNFFAAAALINSKGSVAMVCGDGSAITSALSTWNCATIAKREFAQLSELKLPPVTSAILLLGDAKELSRVKVALENARTNDRAPLSLRTFGPTSESENKAKLTLLVDDLAELELIDLVVEINNRRAISKKELLTIQVHPFSID